MAIRLLSVSGSLSLFVLTPKSSIFLSQRVDARAHVCVCVCVLVYAPPRMKWNDGTEDKSKWKIQSTRILANVTQSVTSFCKWWNVFYPTLTRLQSLLRFDSLANKYSYQFSYQPSQPALRELRKRAKALRDHIRTEYMWRY